MAKIMPDRPRMMRRTTAAAYCDMTTAEFIRWADAPMPVIIAGEERYSRPQLDAALDRLTGDAMPDWRRNAPVYASR